MNFARAKTILIFIFIFVNIFLLLIYNLFILGKKEVDTETLLKVLGNNNITVSEGVIKEQKKTMQGVEVENLAAESEKLALSFLGKKYEKESENLYKKNNISLLVSKKSVELTITDNSDRKYKDISVLNAGNKILKSLSSYNMEKSNLEIYNASEGNNGDFHIEIAYRYEDIPVFNHSIYAIADKKGIKSIKGSIIAFEKIKYQEYNIISVKDVLLDFVDNKDVKGTQTPVVITDVRLGYYLPSSEIELSTYAIPAYEIKLKSGKVYYYDARENIDAQFKLLG